MVSVNKYRAQHERLGNQRVADRFAGGPRLAVSAGAGVLLGNFPNRLQLAADDGNSFVVNAKRRPYFPVGPIWVVPQFVRYQHPFLFLVEVPPLIASCTSRCHQYPWCIRFALADWPA